MFISVWAQVGKRHSEDQTPALGRQRWILCDPANIGLDTLSWLHTLYEQRRWSTSAYICPLHVVYRKSNSELKMHGLGRGWGDNWRATHKQNLCPGRQMHRIDRVLTRYYHRAALNYVFADDRRVVSTLLRKVGTMPSSSKVRGL